MASPASELWNAVHDALTGNAALMALIDDVYDKAPKSPWKTAIVAPSSTTSLSSSAT